MNLVYLRNVNAERIETIKEQVLIIRFIGRRRFLSLKETSVLELYRYMGCVLCVEVLSSRFAVYVNRKEQLIAPGAIEDLELYGEPALSMLLGSFDYTFPELVTVYTVISEERLYSILKKIMNHGAFRHGEWLLEPLDDDLL